MQILLDHGDSPFIRCTGFVYLRYTCPFEDLAQWYVRLCWAHLVQLAMPNAFDLPIMALQYCQYWHLLVTPVALHSTSLSEAIKVYLWHCCCSWHWQSQSQSHSQSHSHKSESLLKYLLVPLVDNFAFAFTFTCVTLACMYSSQMNHLNPFELHIIVLVLLFLLLAFRVHPSPDYCISSLFSLVPLVLHKLVTPL